MNHVHIVIPDLFLPQTEAKNVCADLHLPLLEKFLACSTVHPLNIGALDVWLCQAFSVPELSIAPVTLIADGLNPEEGYWMRADPVHLRLNNAQVILQTNVSPSLEESQQLCESLNQYLADSGIRFFAPHSKRWYVRLDCDPKLTTHSVYQVEGRDSRHFLPRGETSLKWHGVMNEVQMLLYGHPISQSCEARGGLPINSLWFWGGGKAVTLRQPYTKITSDSELVVAFAKTSKILHSVYADNFIKQENQLFVWEGASVALRRGDFYGWRQSVLGFEQQCLAPLLKSLASGGLDKITLDVLQENHSKCFELTRPMLWRFWRRPKSFASYALM